MTIEIYDCARGYTVFNTETRESKWCEYLDEAVRIKNSKPNVVREHPVRGFYKEDPISGKEVWCEYSDGSG